MELMVGMVLMSIFMAMFTGAVLMMNNAMTKAQAVSVSTSQLNTAFLDLDRTVRYAAYISSPVRSCPTCNWHVELLVTHNGDDVCTQLRVDTTSQQLQRRTWTVVNNVVKPSTLIDWAPISSGISNGGAGPGPLTQPFYLSPAGVGVSALFQQLTVNLISPSGSGSSSTESKSSFTFAALNSTIPVRAGSICQQQGQP